MSACSLLLQRGDQPRRSARSGDSIRRHWLSRNRTGGNPDRSRPPGVEQQVTLQLNSGSGKTRSAVGSATDAPSYLSVHDYARPCSLAGGDRFAASCRLPKREWKNWVAMWNVSSSHFEWLLAISVTGRSGSISAEHVGPGTAKSRWTRVILIRQAAPSDTHTRQRIACRFQLSRGGAIQRNKPPRLRVEEARARPFARWLHCSSSRLDHQAPPWSA
jgi:hypothetical protein